MAYILKFPCDYPKLENEAERTTRPCGAPAGSPGGYGNGGRPSFWCQPCTDHFNNCLAAYNAKQRAREAIAKGDLPF